EFAVNAPRSCCQMPGICVHVIWTVTSPFFLSVKLWMSLPTIIFLFSSSAPWLHQRSCTLFAPAGAAAAGVAPAAGVAMAAAGAVVAATAGLVGSTAGFG